ncbi:hypothetical protein AC578_2148 [Pseudocercospora eumusae]|uniref:Uncharacterized protein n=1 Tax=Pseudocercospora eumusae TaxID=321146 RepID=A0A139HHE3_9PEZI|nr:hypothetical protein AC578_2148 [Pseudocercospora eumusae]
MRHVSLEILFSAFLSGDSATKKSTAQAILAVFRVLDFLSNHDIPDDELRSTFSESAKFFARLFAQKDQLAWTTPEMGAAVNDINTALT